MSYFPSSFNYNGLCNSSDVLQLHLPEFINPPTCCLALSKPGTELLNIRDFKLLNAEALHIAIIIAIATNSFLQNTSYHYQSSSLSGILYNRNARSSFSSSWTVDILPAVLIFWRYFQDMSLPTYYIMEKEQAFKLYYMISSYLTTAVELTVYHNLKINTSYCIRKHIFKLCFICTSCYNGTSKLIKCFHH